MKQILILILLSVTITSCGDKSAALKSMGEGVNLLPSPGAVPGPINSTSFTPGSYFKILKEAGSNKDTRVYEFQFLSSNRFIISQTSFMGGDLSKAYFHKKTGTYTEVTGIINYTVTYDSCGDLKPQTTFLSGDRNNIINVVWNGNTSKFFSYSYWTLPSDISSHITDAVDDPGCKIFQE